MQIPKNLLLVLSLNLLSVGTYAQSVENTGWLFISHTQKLSKKFEALADVQVRSADKLLHTETLLLRGGVGYKFSKAHSVALGYTYKGDWMQEENKTSYSPENRIYEQYMFNADIKRTQFTFRFRQEQRFVKETERYEFSQRTRAFLSFQIPLLANADFSKGLYTTLQNEVFVNTQNKQKVNNSFLDQNRPFISIGYRSSKKIDTEIGYMRWLQREMEGDVSTNVFQLMVTTSL